ncbi:MAG: hypothetical protein NZ606_08570, partial [Candidatus Kapabacteria bacterium]|nr:hypothetical protein [Candidatus Kapabacteria bacterium]
TGNSGTTAWNGTTGNYLGTSDNVPLVIATTNEAEPQPIKFWAGNQQVFQLNPPGTAAPAWSIQRDAGGNQRGWHAVDLQSARDQATQVASGNASVIGGGAYNTASGAVGVVAGGGANVASGNASTVGGGLANKAEGDASTVSGGAGNIATGDLSTIVGGYNLKLGARSVGYSGQSSNIQTDLSSATNIAAFVDVDLWLYNVRNQASQLRFYEPSDAGTNYVGFVAPNQIAANVVWKLPNADGTPGQVLATDGNGNLSWVTAGGGGNSQIGTLSDGQIAFWSGGSSGALTGSNNLFWDASNNR